jgi:hypothetical protein
VDESTYAHTSLLYHKIPKKSITIQAMFVSLSRSKVLSSLALAVHFRVELCQIRGPIIKKHPNGVFFVEKNTINALNDIPVYKVNDFMDDLKENRLEYLQRLPDWGKYGDGWANHTNTF